MCLFKPNTYDPKDWQCPKPSCRTVNFKKRMTCISCGARKPEGGARPLDDWRDGEKFQQGPWECDICKIKNEAGAFNCIQCKKPSEDMAKLIEEDKKQRAAEEGRGGGLFDRQDPNDKVQWDSDGEEFDDFGRRKKKKGSATPGAAARASGAASASARTGGSEPSRPSVVGGGSAAGGKEDKHKAALERLRNKHAGGAAGGGAGGGDGGEERGREDRGGGSSGRDRDRDRDRRDGRRRSRSRSRSRRR